MNNNQTPAYVILKADPNPDYFSDDDDHRSFVKVKKTRVPVDSFAKASEICQNFIGENELGSGNWTGGEIEDSNGEIIAHVSYNGRVWEGKEWFKGCKEIKIKL